MNDASSRPTDPLDRPRPDPGQALPGTDGEGDPARIVCFQVSRLSLLYRYLVLLFLTGIGTLLLSLLIPMVLSGRDYLVGGLLALWGLALLRYWVFLLFMPHRICLQGSDALVLHSLFRARRIDCARITAFKVSPIYQSYLKIVTSGKKTFPVLNHVDGLHDLIGRIKRVNPNLRTRGC